MSIDSCYEGLIEKLTWQGKVKEISEKLLTCKTNSERVLQVYDVISDFDAFPEPLEVSKSTDLSLYYRNRGNECFKNSQYFEAWQCYNLSLLHAPTSSDDYALALSNRSAVFFFLKKYKECIKDIKIVLTLNYPERLHEKLVKRQKSCEECLKLDLNDLKTLISERSLEIDEITKLESPRDSTYLCASNKLQVAYNSEMGRHVIAKEDIKVGEVLVEENPYFILLQKNEYLFSCSYCLSRDLNLIPCDNCCFTLFCSEECKTSAEKDYHSVECPLMGALIDLEFTKLELLALRTTIKAHNDHPDWDSLFKTIEDAESNLNSEHRGCILQDDKWIYDSKYYASIHTLATNIERRSNSDVFQKAVTAAVFLKFLSDQTQFLSNNNDGVRRCVADLLLLHIMTSATNMHGLSSNIENAEGNFVEELSLASAPYAFHSLLNHSCAPNVVRYSKLGSGKMTLFALRPIKKGTQIFDNYGSHHALQDLKARQKNLKFQYKFICVCEACVNDWPTYLTMKMSSSKTKVPVNLMLRKEQLLNPVIIDKLQKGDVDTALNIFKPLCELTEVLDPFAPNVELAECQETLKQCLVIFGGLVPYGYSKLVEWDVKTNKNCCITKFLRGTYFSS
ncbi:SET and MYND domain-containing protein 4 [Leguminivora glycinivorella]|uniref:SET and MYND domain-containing protein 4 n=1 Tax=Leguminivora glycinivorella TaxID=1035111 RepID=UPI00200DA19A|nr:SET and MYND domain-containing protein 4 [Leguminivora glycinivorella]